MTGTIQTVGRSGEFAFIRTPDHPGDIFLHRSQLLADEPLAQSHEGKQVDFELDFDKQQRPRAKHARIMADWQ